ncbi:MAG: hypothetical protein RLZZ196_299 [Bacteroidota bacterium]|jgi:hypothetical protein
MELEISQERVEKMVSATYDSFNLINELKAKETLSEEETKMLDVNQQHVRYVLTQDWFTNILTKKQKTELGTV